MAEAREEKQVGGSKRGRGFSWVPGQVSVIMITLAACGLVPWETWLCVVLFSVYIVLMSRFAYPKQKAAPTNAPSFVAGSKILKSYVRFAAYIGLYFPFTYIILGLARGHKEVVHTTAPHTFLLSAQVLSERISFHTNSFSPPSLALVPILYNSGRLLSIWAWLLAHFSTSPLSYWILLGRTLAFANLLLWSYNLFGFLLPLYLPFCFRRYFEYEKA